MNCMNINWQCYWLYLATGFVVADARYFVEFGKPKGYCCPNVGHKSPLICMGISAKINTLEETLRTRP